MVNPKNDEEDMRAGEWFHTLKVPRNMWKVIRLDGRTFSKLTLGYKKPFDLDFRNRMMETTKQLVSEYNAGYAHTHSDEISLCFPPDWELFDLEVEKLVSSTASSATRYFNEGQTDKLGCFDSRIWIGATKHETVRYFSWRSKDCLRCAINGAAYWHMRDRGLSETKATSDMEHKNFSWKNEYLFQYGINFNSLPRWQRRGVAIYWEKYKKKAFNPVTNVEVEADRRRIKTDLIIPDDYEDYVSDILTYGFPMNLRCPTVLPRPEMLEEQNLMV